VVNLDVICEMLDPKVDPF